MRLGKIKIFPIKSLDGICLDEVQFTSGGILANDRLLAIYDENGRVVNGKRTARVHDLRCEFDAGIKEVLFWQSGESTKVRFALEDLDQPLAGKLFWVQSGGAT